MATMQPISIPSLMSSAMIVRFDDKVSFMILVLVTVICLFCFSDPFKAEPSTSHVNRFP